MRKFLLWIRNNFLSNTTSSTPDEDNDGHKELLEELTHLKTKLFSINQELIELEYARNNLVKEIEDKLFIEQFFNK